MSMLEKCRHSLPVLQGIIESTSDDDLMLFEALNLNDEIQKVISKYEEMVASLEPEQPNSDAREELPIHSDDNARELPYHADAKGATLALQNESQRETESLNSLEVGISGSRSETNNKSAQAQKAIPE